MKRRLMIKKTLSCALYAITGAFIAYPIFSFITFRKKREKKIAFGPPEELNRVNFKEGVFLVKENLGMYAFSARCTHLGCTLNYDPVSQQFLCPCHGSAFDVSGKWLSGPAKKDLKKTEMTMNKNKNIIVTLKL